MLILFHELSYHHKTATTIKILNSKTSRPSTFLVACILNAEQRKVNGS